MSSQEMKLIQQYIANHGKPKVKRVLNLDLIHMYIYGSGDVHI